MFKIISQKVKLWSHFIQNKYKITVTNLSGINHPIYFSQLIYNFK